MSNEHLKVKWEYDLDFGILPNDTKISLVYSAICVTFAWDGEERIILSAFSEGLYKGFVQVHNVKTREIEKDILDYKGIAYRFQYCQKRNILLVLGCKVESSEELKTEEDSSLEDLKILQSLYVEFYELGSSKFRLIKSIHLCKHFENPVNDFVWYGDNLMTVTLDRGLEDDGKSLTEKTKAIICVIENALSSDSKFKSVKTDLFIKTSMFKKRFARLKIEEDWVLCSDVVDDPRLVKINLKSFEVVSFKEIENGKRFSTVDTFICEREGTEKIVAAFGCREENELSYYENYSTCYFVGFWKVSGEFIRMAEVDEKVYGVLCVSSDCVLLGGKFHTFFSLNLKNNQVRKEIEPKNPITCYSHAFVFVSYRKKTFRFLSLDYYTGGKGGEMFRIENIVIPERMRNNKIDRDQKERMEFVRDIENLEGNFTVTINGLELLKCFKSLILHVMS